MDALVDVQSPFPDENQDPSILSHSTRNFHSAGEQEDDSDVNLSDGGELDDISGTEYAAPPTISNANLFRFKIPDVPVFYRNVLKCSIAYFVASLFTFSPYFSHIISDVTYGSGERKPSPSGHMVATIAVYFNPAKTVGSMIEADIFCLFGLVYSSFVCLASMSMFWWLELKPGWEWLGDAIVIVWIGLSMSALAWMKVWMASPSFNTACSMTVIIIFVVLVKEGGLQTLVQVSTIVFLGSCTSNLVCFLIWPQSATSNLQGNMIKTLDSFSTLLNTLTKVFLLEQEDGTQSGSIRHLQDAVENHQSSFTSLKKSLNESRSEWLCRDGTFSNSPNTIGTKGFRRSSDYTAYEDAVDSFHRLAQHLNGLRSGTRLQYELTKAGIVDVGSKGKHTSAETQSAQEDINGLRVAAAMFGDLVDDLASPMNALSSTCSSTLERLKEAFIQSHHRRSSDNGIHSQEFSTLIDNIEHSLLRFESTSNHALLRIYRRASFSVHSRPPSTASVDLNASNDDYCISLDNESIFLVYFFIFTLQEFARELVSLVDAMERIYAYEQLRLHKAPWWNRFMSWPISRISKWPEASYILPQNRIVHPAFPKVRPHAPNTMQTPGRDQLNFMGKLKQTIWMLSLRLKERDMKFAIKAGMATAILASPAFFESTRPFFVAYYGDWALISFFVVISPTIGATNYLSFQRVLGTLFGAAAAAAIYTIFPENAIALSLFGFFFSLPCFYVAVGIPQYLSASRFVLLTYNLTCLYCYNLRQKDIYVWDVASHRASAVTVGVIWAGVVSRFWWPTEARRELSKALSEFCLNIGWLYTRLVASNSFGAEYNPNDQLGENDWDPENPLLPELNLQSTRLNNSIHEFMAMELHLQINLIELQGLLNQTQHEPRLKGPFPVELYREILTSLQTILDKLHSMRCVTTREEWYNVRNDFIIPVNKERREMVGNIILSFSVLSSAFRLKAPLPPYLPPAEQSRQRLVEAIRRLDVVRNREAKGSRHLLFFAYALTMKGVTQELEKLGRTLQDVFGVIGQGVEEFEALFFTHTNSGVHL
ncbi:Fusaric acid resistance protein-like-domain-containing protein [Cyathus striatus]|nr:Fusaric acid resistance protein-like-domain-containing protein [Cyathus striatus]